MTFILGEQRQADVSQAFRRYREYLREQRDRFPPGAFSLATSDWYFNPEDHRCPHDAWLQHFVVQEIGRGERHEVRTLTSSVQLLGAYQDLVLTFTYHRVYRYGLDGVNPQAGHQDWRYDEFRVNEQGHLMHEIEWCGANEAARWLIEADDVVLEWAASARGA